MFCAKIGDHAKPWFRLVEADDNWEVIVHQSAELGQQPSLSRDTLRSLMVADPGNPETPRVLGEAAYSGAFGAWQVAQRDIFQMWELSTDPNELMPDVPKALRQAADLVSRSTHLSTEDRISLRKRLNVRPAPKTERAIRQALNEGATDPERVELVRQELDAAGISEASPVEPLTSVNPEEIRLIAWMAITGTKRRSLGKHGALDGEDSSVITEEGLA